MASNTLVQPTTPTVLAIQLTLLQAYYLGLFIATPINRPLVIKELTFYIAKKTTL